MSMEYTPTYIYFKEDRLMSMEYTPTWLHVVIKVNHLLLALNSAANILIYSYKVTKLDNPPI